MGITILDRVYDVEKTVQHRRIEEMRESLSVWFDKQGKPFVQEFLDDLGSLEAISDNEQEQKLINWMKFAEATF